MSLIDKIAGLTPIDWYALFVVACSVGLALWTLALAIKWGERK